MLEEKKLAGVNMLMSLADNRTGEIWRSFMARRKEITNAVSSDVISMQVYPPDYFVHFSPSNPFQKWAMVEVTDFENLPAGFETFVLPGGLYGVFDYKGSSNDSRIFQYIFAEWLPVSAFVLDNRPHFELLGEKYKNGDPASEEQIFIPLQKK